MTAILLDFSQRPELTLHAAIVAAVEAVCAELGAQALIAGAFARDLQLKYRYGIRIERETTDLDIALAVPDWKTFETLRQRLMESGNFRASPGPYIVCGTKTICSWILSLSAGSRRRIGR